MRDALLVAAGGAAGSVARWLVAGAVGAQPGRPPMGTLVVNVVGCFLIGLILTVAESRAWLGAARPFLVTGLLGGFTTYSAFGWETFALAQQRHAGAAAANVALQLACGLAAVWAGARLGATLFAR